MFLPPLHFGFRNTICAQLYLRLSIHTFILQTKMPPFLFSFPKIKTYSQPCLYEKDAVNNLHPAYTRFFQDIPDSSLPTPRCQGWQTRRWPNWWLSSRRKVCQTLFRFAGLPIEVEGCRAGCLLSRQISWVGLSFGVGYSVVWNVLSLCNLSCSECFVAFSIRL